jgi:hypothetical protein
MGMGPMKATKLCDSSGFELCHEKIGKGIPLHLEYVFGFSAYFAVDG